MKIERCRSHEVDSTPQAWEQIFAGSTAEINDELNSLLVVCKASGDQFRVVDGDTIYTPQEFFVIHA